MAGNGNLSTEIAILTVRRSAFDDNVKGQQVRWEGPYNDVEG